MITLPTVSQGSSRPRYAATSGLARAFRDRDAFGPSQTYSLLPFRFMRYDGGSDSSTSHIGRGVDIREGLPNSVPNGSSRSASKPTRYLLTNLVGEYILLSETDFHTFAMRRDLPPNSPLYADLKARHFLSDDVSGKDVAMELLAAKYRTKQNHLRTFTALHLFVVTLRCDHSCPYCQVSRVSEDKGSFDMTEETASRAIDLMFKSPSPVLKVEFQGGESLLNFPLIQYIVKEAKRRNDGRDLEFVIATNLSPLYDSSGSDAILDFCREHGIYISTSLDGPAALHNANRPRPNSDSHARAVAGIQKVRDALGHDAVSALMTTTARSLTMPRQIIDEYVRLGFRSIFLRSISPYGFATKSMPRIGYAADAFLDFYREGLAYILELNKQGTPLREDYASIILQKALTPWATGYVDLQSPSGLGLSVLVYNYDGDVYASDEGRMLAEMRDDTFRLGNVFENSYEDLFLESGLLPLIHETMSEGVPQCTDCAYQPWCGTDPVFHHRTQGDAIGHRPTSEWCRKQMGVFRTLVEAMESDEQARSILRSWAR